MKHVVSDARIIEHLQRQSFNQAYEHGALHANAIVLKFLFVINKDLVNKKSKACLCTSINIYIWALIVNIKVVKDLAKSEHSSIMTIVRPKKQC